MILLLERLAARDLLITLAKDRLRQAIPSTELTGNGSGGGDPGIHGKRSLGNGSNIQQRLSTLMRQLRVLLKDLADSEGNERRMPPPVLQCGHQ